MSNLNYHVDSFGTGELIILFNNVVNIMPMIENTAVISINRILFGFVDEAVRHSPMICEKILSPIRHPKQEKYSNEWV